MDAQTTEFAKTLAKLMVAACVRRGELEGLHAGITPISRIGDFSDVYVVDADGNSIPWTEISRISQDEMKALMIGSVDRAYTFMMRTLFADGPDEVFEAALNRAVLPWTKGWDDPKYRPYFLMVEEPKEV
ncbi:hypothetical protein ATDW_37060 (plasmid) [Asticcacaulis sp. DW145]|uniref:hypothetical protein n=1 Tax=Asticcacaulis sp. DW145 TaxID=3095608 RepID=UPI00308B88C2|nr:hypothetical protein ATDW_37060 [Asticcacaulis sp. DW145]